MKAILQKIIIIHTVFVFLEENDGDKAVELFRE